MAHDVEIRTCVEQACVDYERDLRAFLIGVLRDHHLADDAFQKMVIKAIEAASAVNPETLRGWLFQIALNEAREIKRQTARRGRLERAVWESAPADAQTDLTDGFIRLITEEDKEAVRTALARLEDKYRQVVTRRIYQGQTFAVIAQEMNKPLGTVLTWMRRALMELREMSELRDIE